MAGYDDGRVACTDREIVIRRYYTRRDKRISYQAIREVHQVPLATLGKRSHGSGDGVHWFNHDPGRRRKQVALVICPDSTLTKRSVTERLLMADEIRPVITPDDPDQVTAELTAHGVNVTSTPETAASWWQVIGPRRRRLITIAGVADAGLVAAALADIRRRPAGQIRGPKRLWAVAVLIQHPFGPLSYFAFGRRRQPGR
jgi:hypothetical protein